MGSPFKPRIISLLLLLFICFCRAHPVLSCTPTEPEAVDARMKKTFEESTDIFLATIVSVEKYMAKLPMRGGGFIEERAERVVFRIDRVFKGALAPDNLYMTETLVGGGSCGISVEEWAITLDDNGNEIPVKTSNQWLLSIDPTRPHKLEYGDKPIDMAIEDGEIEMLEILQSKAYEP